MNLKYKGKTPVKRGDTVALIADDKEWFRGKVVDTLASQYTIRVNGMIRFFFYEDKNVTWRKIDA